MMGTASQCQMLSRLNDQHAMKPLSILVRYPKPKSTLNIPYDHYAMIPLSILVRYPVS